MKKIIGVLLLACGLVSCSSCTGPKTPPTLPDGPITIVDAGAGTSSQPITVTANGWSITFPNANWHPDMTNALNALRDASDPATMTAYINEVDKNLLLIATQPFTGTTQQFTLLAVRGLTDSGGKVLSSKSVVINGITFIYLESSRSDGDNLWAWLTVKNNTGYSFVCGGLEAADASQFLLCDQIARTLQLK